MYRREPVHVGGRREASHLALPLTRRVVGNLGSIVRVLTACRAPPLRDRPPHVAEEKTGPTAAGLSERFSVPCFLAGRMQDIESDTGYDTLRCLPEGGLAVYRKRPFTTHADRLRPRLKADGSHLSSRRALISRIPPEELRQHG